MCPLSVPRPLRPTARIWPYYVRVNHDGVLRCEQHLDWPSSWRQQQVGDREWVELKGRVRREYDALIETRKGLETWGARQPGCSMAIVVHTAYHLALTVVQLEQSSAAPGQRVRNDRVIALPIADKRSSTDSLASLSERRRDELTEFFLMSTALENKAVTILGWEGPTAALYLIREAHVTSLDELGRASRNRDTAVMLQAVDDRRRG